jgi:hypothetical protein
MGTNLIQRPDGGMDFQDSSGNIVGSIGGAVQSFRNIKVAKIPITGVAATTGGALFSWANPEQGSIIIERFQIDITTASTGAANGSFGVAANGTTSSANLIDTYALASTAKVVDNHVDNSTNGKFVQKMTTSQFVTGTGSATTAGLVGNVYIHYYLA